MQAVGRAAGLAMAWFGIGAMTLWLLGFGPPGLRLGDLGLPSLTTSTPPQTASGPSAPAPTAESRDAAPAPAITATSRLALSGPASPAPVLDAAAVPFLNPAGRDAYRTWLTVNLPRVFALAPNGSYAWVGGGSASMDQLRTKALDQCAARGTQGCTIYAENLAVTWSGQRSAPQPPPGPHVSGPGYTFIPDDRYVWHGPDTARGVYVWAHGFNGPTEDIRGLQPQPHVRPFNNAGFDILRFDRAPRTDRADSAAVWLRDGLAQLRQQGYGFIVVGGQSRGAWNALQMLDTPGAADAVVAVSPAAHGQGPGSRVNQQLTDLRRIMDAMPPSRTRVAIVQFADDGYSADPEWRAELFRLNEMHLGDMLMIDRPEGHTGHAAGATNEFGQRFGPCLLRFVQGQPSSCPR